MKICPHCYYDLPDDATFCTHCGKPIETIKKDIKLTKKERAKIQSIEVKKEKAEKNIWNSLGLFVFLLAFIGLDWVLGMIFNTLNWEYKIIYIISSIFYLIVLGCAIMSIRADRKAKKEGKEAYGNAGIPVALISFSSYIMLMNVQAIILK